jgi:hypothetical protein
VVSLLPFERSLTNKSFFGRVTFKKEHFFRKADVQMWQKAPAGMARRMILEDGTPVVAVLKPAPEGEQASFFSDVPDLDRLEFESERLGSLSDLIDVIQPADIIEICCRIQASPKP